MLQHVRDGEEGPLVVPALARALGDANELVCWIAADCLGQIGPAAREAVPALRQALRRDFRLSLIRTGVLLALEHIDPQAPEHFLVIPKQHVAALTEVSDWALVGHLHEVATSVARERMPNGFRSLINTGPDGVQTVFNDYNGGNTLAFNKNIFNNVSGHGSFVESPTSFTLDDNRFSNGDFGGEDSLQIGVSSNSYPGPYTLAPVTINKTLDVLQGVLALALEYGHIATNPAAGKRRRLKPPARHFNARPLPAAQAAGSGL